jgi:predicted  nucleic acid-binding Zn-ribbon protein
MSNPESLPSGLPLIAYAEHLCKGSRVLLSAELALPLAEALLERGARLVHVFEKDPVARAEAETRAPIPQLTFSAPDYDLREGFFDLVLVENLGTEQDPVAAARGYARLLAPRGAALIAAPNPEVSDRIFAGDRRGRALDYYTLYDAVAGAFPLVRMIGQVPFVGRALIDFSAEGEPSPVFDTSLLPARGEEPDGFLALASREAKSVEGYVVVQLPSSVLERSGVHGAPPPTLSSVPPAHVVSPSPAAAPPSLASVERVAQILRDDARERELETRALAFEAREKKLEAREKELEQRLARQEAWILELEARAATADERADAAEAELDELRERQGNLEQSNSRARAGLAEQQAAVQAELERLRRRANDASDLLELKQSEIRALEAELLPLKAEIAPLRAEVVPLRAEVVPLRAEVAPLRAEVEALRTELANLMGDAGPGEEVEKLEAQLKEQGQRIRSLERDVREAERTGRELLRKLNTERERAAAPGVAARLVEAEAELVSLRWSLQIIGRSPSPGVIPRPLL